MINVQNWKTTAAGILTALGTALMLAPLPEKWKWLPAFMTGLGSALIGVTAKDFNNHSTQAEVKEATAEAGKPK